MYRVVVERSAEKDLRRLPLDVRSRVADALRSLADDPRPVGSRKLAGTKHDWRIRVGDYRVIYLPGGRADATGDVRRYALETGGYRRSRDRARTSRESERVSGNRDRDIRKALI